jgi:hypothetical protein
MPCTWVSSKPNSSPVGYLARERAGKVACYCVEYNAMHLGKFQAKLKSCGIPSSEKAGKVACYHVEDNAMHLGKFQTKLKVCGIPGSAES